MSRPCTICTHPQRAEIDRALVAGTAYRIVSSRFGISTQALFRHRSSHLTRRLNAARQRAYRERQRIADEDTALVAQEQAMEAGDLGIATDLVAEAEQCLRRLARLCDACDDYLRHPGDPNRYDLSPRAEEIMVTYSDDGGPRKRAPLSELLSRLPDTTRRDRIELDVADPRRLLVQASARVHAQLHLLAQLDGRIEAAPESNPLTDPEWEAVRVALLGALEGFPEARDTVIDWLLLAKLERVQALAQAL